MIIFAKKYSKVSLKHVFLRHENEVRRLFRSGGRIKPIYVHCSLLNMHDNIVNGKKSDVIAAIYYDDSRSRKSVLAYSLPNDSPKILKYDNKIKLNLTTSDGQPVWGRANFGVIYELEFS